jgi:PAS domain S-box-containing protein
MVGLSRVVRRQKGREPRSFDGLDEVIVRVTTWIAVVFFLFLVLAGIVSGDEKYFYRALNPVGPAVAGMIMLAVGRPRVIWQLAVGGIGVAVTSGFIEVDSRSGALLGLLSMAIVGSLLVRKHVFTYLATASIGLFGVAYWWNVSELSDRDRIAEALGPSLAFLLTAGLVVWLKRELVTEGSQRQAAVAALATSEAQFRMAFETSAAGMALVDVRDGRLLRVNRSSCGMLGYSESDLLGMTFWQVCHPDDLDEAAASFTGVVSGELEHAQTTLRYVRRDGSIAYGLVSAALITDQEGNACQVVVQVVDTTDQREAEQRLLDLLSSRDELIASVSHELRTPLTAVLGYASLLVEAPPGDQPDDYAAMLGEIVSQGSDLVAIIEDLLVFAQSDAQSLTVTPSSVDMRQQLGLVLGSLEGLGAVDHVAISGPDVEALADPVRIRQVLRNLLSNAGRYGGDSVAVVLDSTGSQVRIVVSDNGGGVPPQDRERIFEPYQRSRPEDGLTAAIGVGLTVARRLSRLMGGDLTYSYRDGWSRFELLLPAAATELSGGGGRSRPSSSQPPGSRALKVEA